jgi:uncharacterized protein YjbI with pentapeptide repeats
MLQIKSRLSEKVLFEYESDKATIKEALTSAIKEDANLVRANLRGANLRGADLRGADLIFANLGFANLGEADLEDADLGGADLEDANLRDANLRGADLIFADLRFANLRGANLRDANLGFANLEGANLEDADLRGANLRSANLIGANLKDANLIGANLKGANLRGANELDIPTIKNIHQKVYKAASAPNALDMDDWHNSCGTTHCRAGWVTTLSGEKGKALENKVGPELAGYLIYRKSDPSAFAINFFADNATAMADMKAMAEKEAAKTA